MSEVSGPRAGIATVHRALEILVAPGAVVELRIPRVPRRNTVSGYFSDVGRMAQSAVAMSGKAEGVYVTLNPVKPDLLARASNRLIEFAKHATKDSDVLCRCWFVIDLDPIRAAGISSTDAEHDVTLERARQVRDWLRMQVWPDPVQADSGNGAHLLYRLDLPNDDSSAELLKSCLPALALRFEDSAVKVDLETHNASRIVKVYGTLAAKGDALPERPYRLARLVDVPTTREPVAVKLLVGLAARVPKPEPMAQSRTKSDAFDLARWIADHELDVDGPIVWNGGRLWRLRVCQWNPAHADRSAYLVQFSNGAIAAGCLHESCRGKSWHALRDVVEPGWKAHSAQYKAEAWAEWKIPFQTAAEVATQTPERIEWIAYPWVAKGAATEVECKIKTAGKTTFVTHMVAAVLDGAPFLGEPTTETPVVYLTEQPRTSFRQALARACLLDRKDLAVLFWHDLMPVPWSVVARAAIRNASG